MTGRRSAFDILGIAADERALKLWTRIQQLKAASNANPALNVIQPLDELSRDHYELTGAGGR